LDKKRLKFSATLDQIAQDSPEMLDNSLETNRRRPIPRSQARPRPISTPNPKPIQTEDKQPSTKPVRWSRPQALPRKFIDPTSN
jgi:hypothetical protein